MRQHEASHPSLNPPLTPSPPSSLQMPFRVNFPSFFMALIRAPTQAQPYQAVFRVAPAMNKLEIREYLTKIYGLSVRKVMTANLAGRRKRYVCAWVCKYCYEEFLLLFVVPLSSILLASLNCMTICGELPR